MLVGFVPDWMRGKAEVNQERIQQLLEENDQLTCCMVDYQNKCVQYQRVCQPIQFFKIIECGQFIPSGPAQGPGKRSTAFSPSSPSPSAGPHTSCGREFS
uniref:SS18 N-terminal domain-containing protein n=1 Tax=Urocitellus parryii TaxID=9999 RepID=A0A8D2IAT4_UROPR